MKIKLILCFYFLTISYFNFLHAQQINANPLQMDSILKQGPEYDLIKPLVGKWTVIQNNYSTTGQKLMQDTFMVERKMVGNFLQEVMQPIVKTAKTDFTRTTYLNYNKTNFRWEYVVMDTRFPVMMFETSVSPKITGDSIALYLDAFFTPPLLGKEYTGMMAKERRIITFKNNDLNIHRQYWTLPAMKEFLSIEYIFKRQ